MSCCVTIFVLLDINLPHKVLTIWCSGLLMVELSLEFFGLFTFFHVRYSGFEPKSQIISRIVLQNNCHGRSLVRSWVFRRPLNVWSTTRWRVLLSFKWPYKWQLITDFQIRSSWYVLRTSEACPDVFRWIHVWTLHSMWTVTNVGSVGMICGSFHLTLMHGLFILQYTSLSQTYVIKTMHTKSQYTLG